MNLEALIETYGYAALFVGTFLEGETILLIAGFAAHRGYFSLSGVLLVAFLGSLAGDQLWFFVGRWHGGAFLAKRPRWQARAARARALLDRYHWPVLLAFRFFYGLRTVTPFVIGASGFSVRRFVPLNVLGAALWAAIIGTLGYLFGQAIELVLVDAKRYELAAIIVLAALGAALWAWHVLRRR